ncbi:MAG: helix-turn-helix transcriptional regulator [Asgard group archaeon]|nr:helix-turn-helix transcriptional regulator [Asgard group archaeon]
MAPENTLQLDIKALIKRLEVLLDPQRTKIYLYVKINGQATTDELADVLQVNKSTLSYHLTKMVESNLLSVQTPPTGRLVKIYKLPTTRIHVDFNFDETIKNQNSEEIWDYLKSLALEYRFLANRIEYFLDTMDKTAFHSIERGADNLLHFKLHNQNGFLPSFRQYDITAEDAQYIESELIRLINEKILEKCNSQNDSIEKRREKEKLYYTFTLGMFPILD